jgi:hypothetical protein
LITVHSPLGFTPDVERTTPAARPSSLRTVDLVDVRFDDSIELLKQVQAWFARHIPSAREARPPSRASAAAR